MNKLIFILKHKLLKKTKISYSSYLKGYLLIKLGKKIKIMHHTYLDCSRGGTITVGDKVTVSHFCQLQARGGSIRIDEGTEINNFSLIYTGGSNISIGKNVLIGPRVNIIGYQHDFSDLDIPIKFQPYISKDIIINDNVWIGSSSIIMSGITIGEGAIIGAGSVVTKNIEKYTINVGNPCKQIRKREKNHD
jgi:acetyltransferase-like isoleucine patch superfamily enzyme